MPSQYHPERTVHSSHRTVHIKASIDRRLHVNCERCNVNCLQCPKRFLSPNIPADSKYPSASSTDRKIFVAVSVMNGDGFLRGFHTTYTSLVCSKACCSSRSTPEERPGVPPGSSGI